MLRDAIAQREGWLCKIRGLPVGQTLTYPDPMYPSLDHIVPVTDGGTNDVWNLRLASHGLQPGSRQLWWS